MSYEYSKQRAFVFTDEGQRCFLAVRDNAKALIDAVKGRIEALKAADPGNSAPVPADLVTASGSGLDPHLSLRNAAIQAPRVAQARKLSADKVKRLMQDFTEGPDLGFLGDPGVNVLRLNLALDALSAK